MESPALSEFDLHLFAEGRHWHIYNVLGAHPLRVSGKEGVRFAVWAPNARSVSVIGDFNGWNSAQHVMRANESSGVWSLFIPGVQPGAIYKFAINTARGEIIKTDPYGQAFEHRPSNAAVVTE